MLKIDKINSLFNYQLCQSLVKDPVVLPCGETVCKIHTKEINHERCMFCTENHKAHPIFWSLADGVYTADSAAFLFSLTNPNFTPLRLKCTKPKYALVHNSPFGPLFGDGNDLLVTGLSNRIRSSSSQNSV